MDLNVFVFAVNYGGWEKLRRSHRIVVIHYPQPTLRFLRVWELVTLGLHGDSGLRVAEWGWGSAAGGREGSRESPQGSRFLDPQSGRIRGSR